MAFEDYKIKPSVVIVYQGDGKGKTTAALGLMARALGHRSKVAFIQFIKYWGVSEHVFIRDIQPIYGKDLYFYKGGKGFYKAGELSAKNISEQEHKASAQKTFEIAYQLASSGKYNLVICDEINNAVHDKLLSVKDLKKLIKDKHPDTSLCLTGRNFPDELLDLTDIATHMTKQRHHFDNKYLANQGIDF